MIDTNHTGQKKVATVYIRGNWVKQVLHNEQKSTITNKFTSHLLGYTAACLVIHYGGQQYGIPSLIYRISVLCWFLFCLLLLCHPRVLSDERYQPYIKCTSGKGYLKRMQTSMAGVRCIHVTSVMKTHIFITF
jgi:hypothetical protein